MSIIFQNSIFDYLSASRFLKDRWELKKSKNQLFSMRAWAKSLGFANNSPLSLMLSGKRSIPKKYVPAFVKSLELSESEATYLEILIEFERQKKPETKAYYLKKLQGLAPKKKIESLELDTFKYLENPLCMILLEMIDLDDFEFNISWIKNRLIQKYTYEEIQNCIDLLLKLGFLNLDEENQLVKTHQFIKSKSDIADIAVKNYHQNTLKSACNAIFEQKLNERELNSFTLNIKQSDLVEAKAKIRNFLEDFITDFATQEKGKKECYQINVQLFKNTREVK